MKCVLIFLVVITASLWQGSNGSTDIRAGETPAFLDQIFAGIRAKIEPYVKDMTFGPNLLLFFDQMVKEVMVILINAILKAISDGANLFEVLWDFIIKSADVGYKGTPLAGIFIQTFLEIAKSKMTIVDLVCLMLGPYDELFKKVQQSADEAAVVAKAQNKEFTDQNLKDFKDLMSALKTGLESDMAEPTKTS